VVPFKPQTGNCPSLFFLFFALNIFSKNRGEIGNLVGNVLFLRGNLFSSKSHNRSCNNLKGRPRTLLVLHLKVKRSSNLGDGMEKVHK